MGGRLAAALVLPHLLILLALAIAQSAWVGGPRNRVHGLAQCLFPRLRSLELELHLFVASRQSVERVLQLRETAETAGGSEEDERREGGPVAGAAHVGMGDKGLGR